MLVTFKGKVEQKADLSPEAIQSPQSPQVMTTLHYYYSVAVEYPQN